MNYHFDLFSPERISKYKHRIIINKKLNVGNNNIRPAIFLDRDGVIIEDFHYLSKPVNVKLLPGAIELISKAKEKKFIIVVVTNQSGISRGFFDWGDYELVTEKMLRLIGRPFSIDAIYANGYSPSDDLPQHCWRKPSPEMILTASKDLNIDLSNSILIGDRFTDIKCAQNGGIKNIFHVSTGHGNKEKKYILEQFSDSTNSLHMIDNLTQFPYDKYLNI